MADLAFSLWGVLPALAINGTLFPEGSESLAVKNIWTDPKGNGDIFCYVMGLGSSSIVYALVQLDGNTLALKNVYTDSDLVTFIQNNYSYCYIIQKGETWSLVSFSQWYNHAPKYPTFHPVVYNNITGIMPNFSIFNQWINATYLLSPSQSPLLNVYMTGYVDDDLNIHFIMSLVITNGLANPTAELVTDMYGNVLSNNYLGFFDPCSYGAPGVAPIQNSRVLIGGPCGNYPTLDPFTGVVTQYYVPNKPNALQLEYVNSGTFFSFFNGTYKMQVVNFGVNSEFTNIQYYQTDSSYINTMLLSSNIYYSDAYQYTAMEDYWCSTFKNNMLIVCAYSNAGLTGNLFYRVGLKAQGGADPRGYFFTKNHICNPNAQPRVPR